MPLSGRSLLPPLKLAAISVAGPPNGTPSLPVAVSISEPANEPSSLLVPAAVSEGPSTLSVSHMDEVSPRLWIGDIQAATNVALLAAQDIRAIVSVVRGSIELPAVSTDDRNMCPANRAQLNRLIYIGRPLRRM